jgi:predicted RNase H-like HicB family nuclease
MIDGFRALSQDEENVFISSTIIFSLMFAEYIQAAMEKATYEIIDDPEPFYGEVPELQGLWATGKTLEECRKNLMEALEDWIAAHLAWGYPIPPLEGHIIQVSKEPMAVAD